MIALRVLFLTAVTMIAFAANSILCRLALRETSVDALTFTTIRLGSGALALFALTYIRRKQTSSEARWPSAIALFIYAAAFAFAYVSLSAGTGALLLFGAVQATMVIAGLRSGERLSAVQSAGLLIAIAGFVGLVLPGISAPAPLGSALMIAAGIAWGIYSLRGRKVADPSLATAGNFLRAASIALLVSAAALPWMHYEPRGAALAAFSGVFASGLGYILWYTVLPALTATRAAAVQLSVPVIAALGGIMFLGEAPSVRLAIASLAILGGIALVIADRDKRLWRQA